MSESALYLVESGKALEMVRSHITEKAMCDERVAALGREAGGIRAMRDRTTGVMTALVFPKGAVPIGFTSPESKHGSSRPIKGSDWAAKFKAQVGYPDVQGEITAAFGVPTQIDYTTPGGTGSRAIGAIFDACGFLYLSADGPYAMYTPDVQAEVLAERDKGNQVDQAARAYSGEIPGCRRIEQEEWDILVAQHFLAEKRRIRDSAARGIAA